MPHDLKPFYRIPVGTRIWVRELKKTTQAQQITTRKPIDLDSLPKPVGRQYELEYQGFFLSVPQMAVERIDPQQRLF